jgi:hypothetical protein
MDDVQPGDSDPNSERIRDAEDVKHEQIRKRRPRDDDDDDRPRRRRRRSEGDSPIPCPKCGSRWLRGGPWPWYLGTIGTFLCNVKTCEECGHVFDAKKPEADWGSRSIKLALILNGIGGLGIVAVIGGLILLIMATMK